MPKFSPFFTFVHFYRNEERKNGRHLTLDQAKTQAEGIWEEMAESQKQTFYEMAEDQTTEFRKHTFQKHSKARNKTVFRDKVRGVIDQILSNSQDLRKQHFYFIAVYEETYDRLPSEISVLRFSLALGAEEFLHFLLNPEVSQSQYSLYKENMREPITVVPIEGTDNSDMNLREVLNAIHQFCQGIVFTMPTSTETIMKCLAKLRKKCPDSQREIIPLDGSELIFMLWERSRDSSKASLTDVRITCSSQPDLEHLACQYHKSCDKTPVCTLWKPYALAYAMANILSEPYDVLPAEGYHKPNIHWSQPGKYFSGKKDYEPWMFSSTKKGHDGRSASNRGWGESSKSGWGSEPSQAGWGQPDRSGWGN